MGKRRSNQNKRKKNKKVLENKNDKKAISVLHQNAGNENNYCSEEFQESSEVQLPNYKYTSCKQLNEIHKCSPRENNTTEKDKSLTEDIGQAHKNVSKDINKFSLNHETEESKLSEEICKTSIKKPQIENQYTYSDKHIVHPLKISGRRDKFPESRAQMNDRLHGNDKNNSNSYFPIEKSVMARRIGPNSGSQSCLKEEDDKLTFARNLISESEEEYSISDVFKPNFGDWSGRRNNRVPLEKRFHRPVDKSDFLTENTFSSEASCSGFKTSEKPAFNGKKLKDTISCSVHAYKDSKDYFSNMYHTWLPQRRNTLQKLITLKAEVRNTQLGYNKSQEILRETGLMSRTAKNLDNQVIDFFASCTAFLSDATSGLVSVVQAFNIESYQNKFKEIIELDAEITQHLYKARSQCVTKYHNIEEVMRKFHSDNLSSTINKISDSLEIGKYWEGMKKAYENDSMPHLLDLVSKFFDNACQSTKLQEVGDSIERYIDGNPATLDAFKSAGRATYEAINTLKLNRIQNKLLRGVDLTTNHLLMIDDRLEIQRLRSTAEDSPQSKLEAQIEEAIDHLESELREIKNIYFELFKSCSSSDSDDSECEISGYYSHEFNS